MQYGISTRINSVFLPDQQSLLLIICPKHNPTMHRKFYFKNRCGALLYSIFHFLQDFIFSKIPLIEIENLEFRKLCLLVKRPLQFNGDQRIRDFHNKYIPGCYYEIYLQLNSSVGDVGLGSAVAGFNF